jgi:hypothetical protein
MPVSRNGWRGTTLSGSSLQSASRWRWPWPDWDDLHHAGFAGGDMKQTTRLIWWIIAIVAVITGIVSWHVQARRRVKTFSRNPELDQCQFPRCEEDQELI